ncbi:MAG: metal-dependent hydrolase [Halofilum sp. (in: g-proteobacteria)]
MNRVALAVVTALTLALSTPVGAEPPPPPQGQQEPQLQWLGQSAIKITTAGGRTILVDPFISSNPVTPDEHQDLTALGEVDLILVTHAHRDHWGDTRAIAERTGAAVGVNADFGSTLRTLGILPQDQLIRFNKSGPITPVNDGVTITMTRAEHSSDFVHGEAGEAPRVHPGGEPVGYIIELENGYTIWHMGDTGVFADMQWISRFYEPDLVLMPIGGHYTMNPEHAAYATEQFVTSGTIVPIHYGTFAPLTGTPEAFREALSETARPRVSVMEPGETRPLN